ncbi:MAG: flippase-like domain-containing protein [Proteobacteria bacterium]|nr:flippase-like domain-containing protein [Pseudomonadota bacterium]
MRTRVAIVIALTVVFLLIVLWGVDVELAATDLRHVRWWWVLLALVLQTINLAVRTWRFEALLDAAVGWWRLFSVMAVSFMAINVMPFRLGEGVRPYLLAEMHHVSVGDSLAAVVQERLLDILALAVLLILVGWGIEGQAIVAGVDIFQAGQSAMVSTLLVGLVGVVVVMVVGRPLLEPLSAISSRVSPTVGQMLQAHGGAFVDSFQAMAVRPWKLGIALLLTALAWLLAYGVFFAMAMAFGDMTHGPMEVCAALVGAMVGVVVLPTPGFFGGYEAGSVAVLRLVGVTPHLSRVFSIVTHLVVFGHTVILGLLFAFYEGYSLRRLMGASQAMELQKRS